MTFGGWDRGPGSVTTGASEAWDDLPGTRTHVASLFAGSNLSPQIQHRSEIGRKCQNLFESSERSDRIAEPNWPIFSYPEAGNRQPGSNLPPSQWRVSTRIGQPPGGWFMKYEWSCRESPEIIR